MSHSFPIIFDPNREAPERVSSAGIVVTPLDDFTKQIVLGPVTAKLKDWGNVARRSGSGHLVFEKLVAGDTYTVEVDALRAGYFQPASYDVTVRADLDTPLVDATRILPLILRPERVVDGETMVVRGQVVDGAGDPAPDVTLEAKVTLATDTPFGPPEPPELTFFTLTNAKGNFAMRMRPPKVSLSTTPKYPLVADVLLQIDGNLIFSDPLTDFTTKILDTPIVMP